MYSLTFRVRVTTPPAVWTKWNGARRRRVHFVAGEESLRRHAYTCVCGMRAACGGPGGLPLGSATHFHSVAIATQLVHREPCRIYANARTHRGLSKTFCPGEVVAMLGGSRPNPFCKCAIVGLSILRYTLLTVLVRGRVESFRG